MSYQLTENENIVKRAEDNAFVCRDGHGWDAYETWLAEGNTPQPLHAPRTFEQFKQDLMNAATAQRWEHETGGITMSGVRVGTTLDDQNRISGVLSAIALGTLEEVDFKAKDGWVKLTALQIQAIGARISMHVQDCFGAERAHHEAIAALTEEVEYDVTQGWPE